MMVVCDVKFDTKYDQIPQNSNQEPSTSSKYDYSWRTSIDARELKIGEQLKN